MYTPPHFRVDDTATAHEIIRRYSFATLITVVDGHPSISHLPFLFEADQSAHGKLVAHMARANPQWRSFPDGGKVTVVFQGPHAYVSPRTIPSGHSICRRRTKWRCFTPSSFSRFLSNAWKRSSN